MTGAPRLLAAAAAAATCFAAACGGAVRRSEHTPRNFPAGVLELRWRTTIHEHGLFEPRPEECATGVVVGSRLIIGSRQGNIVALDVADGRVLWSTPVSGALDSEARYDASRGQVYAGSDDGFLYAVDPATGGIRWSHKTKGAVERPPEIDAESVYLATAEDRVLSLDARTGRFRWQYERERPEGFTIHGHAGPRLHGNRVYAGFADGYLVALNAPGGEVIWARSLAAASEQYVDIDSTPTVMGDTIIASSFSGGLYTIAALTGDIRWRLGLEGTGTARVFGNRIYFASPREGLAALTLEGRMLWRQGLSEAGELTPPAFVGPYLMFSGARAGLFVVDRTAGTLLQLFNPGRGVCGSVALDPEMKNLYVLVNSGTLYGLRVLY